MKKFRIAQVGSFDVENYGDLLFSYVFKEKIKEHFDDVEITLFAPLHCISPFTEDVQVRSVNEMEKLHNENPFDGIVIGGGDLVQFKKINVLVEDENKNQKEEVYDVLSMWFIPGMIAMKYNIPIIWNALGVPFELSEIQQKFMANFMSQSLYVSVRDNTSRKNLGLAADALNVKVVTDSILSISKLVKKEDLKERFNNIYNDLGVSFDKENYIVVHVNKNIKDEEVTILCEKLRNIKNKYGVSIVLMPIGYTLYDDQGINKLKENADEFVQIKKKLAPFDMMSVIANAKFYIGASLHGCVTSTAFNIPNMVYNYGKLNKIEGFLENTKRSYAVLYDPTKLDEYYDEINNKEIPPFDDLLLEIDNHFKNMADVIKDGKKVKINLDDKLLDEILCLENTSDKELAYCKKILEEKDTHIRNLDAIIVDRETKLEAAEKKNELYEKEVADKNNHINNIENIIKINNEAIENLRMELAKERNEKEMILNSMSYKITKPLRKASKIVKKKK